MGTHVAKPGDIHLAENDMSDGIDSPFSKKHCLKDIFN